MPFTPILAEDYGGVLLVISLIVLGLGAIGFGSVALSATAGKGKSWGFLLGLIPAIGGGLMLFFFLTVRGGAPIFFHFAAGVPFLCGCASLYLWGKANPESSRKVGLAFRFLLYGVLIIVFLYLLTMLTNG